MLLPFLLFLLSIGLRQNRLSGSVRGQGERGSWDGNQRSQISVLVRLWRVQEKRLSPTDISERSQFWMWVYEQNWWRQFEEKSVLLNEQLLVASKLCVSHVNIWAAGQTVALANTMSHSVTSRRLKISQQMCPRNGAWPCISIIQSVQSHISDAEQKVSPWD